MFALCTLCIGSGAAKVLSISQPLLARYAESVSAHFEVIGDRKFPCLPVYFEKFQLFYYLEVYDRIIYVDTDVLISRGCCNLFDLVSPDLFGASLRDKKLPFFSKSINWANRTLGIIEWPIGYFNSGVMVISRIHKSLFSPEIFDLKSFKDYIALSPHLAFFDQADQTLICYLANVQKTPFYDLGDKYNLSCVSRFWRQRKAASIIHYAGINQAWKADMMRHDLRWLL